MCPPLLRTVAGALLLLLPFAPAMSQDVPIQRAYTWTDGTNTVRITPDGITVNGVAVPTEDALDALDAQKADLRFSFATRSGSFTASQSDEHATQRLTGTDQTITLGALEEGTALLFLASQAGTKTFAHDATTSACEASEGEYLTAVQTPSGWNVTCAPSSGGGSGGGDGVWGSITGTLSNQTDLAAALAAKAPLSVSASAQTGSFNVASTHIGKTVPITTGGITATFPDGLTDGGSVLLWNQSAGTVTVSGAAEACTIPAGETAGFIESVDAEDDWEVLFCGSAEGKTDDEVRTLAGGVLRDSLIAGTNVTITEDENGVTIAASGGGTTVVEGGSAIAAEDPAAPSDSATYQVLYNPIRSGVVQPDTVFYWSSVDSLARYVALSEMPGAAVLGEEEEPGGGGGVFVSDAFTDTDGTDLAAHTGETGATWANQLNPGHIEVLSNRIVPSTNSTGSTVQTIYTASGTPPSADYYVQAEHHFLQANSDPHDQYLLARFVDLDNFIMARYNPSTETYQLYERAGGTTTLLGESSVSSYPATPASVTLRLEVNGTSARVLADGVEVIANQAVSGTSAGSVGFRYIIGGFVETTTSANMAFDDFEAGGL